MAQHKLHFLLDKYISVNGYKLPYDQKLEKDFTPLIYQPTSASPIKQYTSRLVEPVIYKILSIRNYLFVDGFIENILGKFIKTYLKPSDNFLEIGCGDMSMQRFLPKSTIYNAFDVRLSKYYLLKQKNNPQANIAIASTLQIPLPNNSVDFVLISEVLYEIENADLAIKEIYRILSKNGLVAISISNSYCYKYKIKGPHPRAKNFWSFKSFIDHMKKNNFSFVEGTQKGIWVPLPLWLTKISYQLPLTHKNEFYNTNFFYIFKK